MSDPDRLHAFVEEVGSAGPVACVGGRTQWGIGASGRSEADVREVRAPVGIVAHEPADMTVRVGAGTTVRELDDALAERGQRVTLPEPGPGATVGGVLAVGRADVRRLGWGPVRDTLLEARYVSAEGTLIKAGGPTVKNVSGFDLCRLLVGSLGTLGLLGEVVLRARPRPAAVRWMAGSVEPEALTGLTYRAASILWDGSTTWVLLEGHEGDLDTQGARLCQAGLADVEGPPLLPEHRWSVDPASLLTAAGEARFGSSFVAEMGVGVVHTAAPPTTVDIDPTVRMLNERVKYRFDPTGRLNPAREPLAAVG